MLRRPDTDTKDNSSREFLFFECVGPKKNNEIVNHEHNLHTFISSGTLCRSLPPTPPKTQSQLTGQDLKHSEWVTETGTYSKLASFQLSPSRSLRFLFYTPSGAKGHRACGAPYSPESEPPEHRNAELPKTDSLPPSTFRLRKPGEGWGGGEAETAKSRINHFSQLHQQPPPFLPSTSSPRIFAPSGRSSASPPPAPAPLYAPIPPHYHPPCLPHSPFPLSSSSSAGGRRKPERGSRALEEGTPR